MNRNADDVTATATHKLNHLPQPRSVAVVGASRLEGGSYFGARTMSNMVAADSAVTLLPVNPRLAGEEILGHRVYASLTELPTVPDLAVICTPVPTVLDLLGEAGRLGVSICVVLASHTGTSAERRAFDRDIGTVSSQFEMTVIGPNSLGVFQGQAAVSASFSTAGHAGAVPVGDVSVVSQSGAVLSYILQTLRGTSIGFSWLISTGNEAAASLESLLESLATAADTRIILLFIEGVADGRRFREAALRARLEDKVIVMMSVGDSESGQRAVQSHTGRIAGARQAFEAVAAESGIIAVPSYEPMFDAVASMSEQGLARASEPHGRRAAVITASGGLAVSLADQLSHRSWTMPPISESVVAAIGTALDQRDVINPIDVIGAFGKPPAMGQVLRELAAETSLDAIFITIGAGGAIAEEVARNLAAARAEVSQEVYACWIGVSDAVRKILVDGGISCYPDPVRVAAAAEASARFRSFGAAQRHSAAVLADLSTSVADLGDGEDHRLHTAAETLAELVEHGVACVPTMCLDGLDAEKVVAAAGDLGYPVAVKIESSQLSHKSDAGGVKVGLADAHAVRDAVVGLTAVVDRLAITDAQVVVQPMITGVEVLVGVKNDPSFGPMLVVGLGGIFTELFADVVTALLPSERGTLDRMLARHDRLTTLLSGFRGHDPGNREALLDLLESVATWAVSRPGGIAEMDLNPVIVNAVGAYAVDARMVAR